VVPAGDYKVALVAHNVSGDVIGTDTLTISVVGGPEDSVYQPAVTVEAESIPDEITWPDNVVGLGSVRQVLDSSGNVKNTYTYSPFGTDPNSQFAETIDNPLRFTGQWYDGEIGQYYLRARQYEPQLMRFTAIDPVLGKPQQPLTLHVYLYCANDPLNRIDPFGQDYVDINVTWTHGTVLGAVEGLLVGGSLTQNPIGGGIGLVAGGVIGGFGATGGIMFERNEAHLYLGLAWSSNPFGGIDLTLSIAPDPSSTVESGWHIAGSVSIAGAYGQWGRSLQNGTTFKEVGLTTGTSLGWGFGGSC